ncbi:uncharacterized protein LOC129981344 isoform X1 [Argiope bruennichi]|uniref:uncharacterized protein LOC129981344 isoform X1 n=1 Tax=Argiope bruennichi TaxID=94029 RepID=UPI0024944381|nr:uncharacterized protein LOC129981344 isoform X1 [Argiope bruennichi]
MISSFESRNKYISANFINRNMELCRFLLLIAVLPCLVLADTLFSSDDSKKATGVETLDALPSSNHSPARRGIFSKCNFLTCKGKCCGSDFCCPFSGAKCCPDNKCCPKGTQCCPVGCCPKGQDCCGGGCCADGQKCCGSWCCKKKQQCGNTPYSCYG